MTCGQIGQTFINPLRSSRPQNLGCWCYLPLKVQVPCNCWARNNGIHEIGWPEHLNSFPEQITPESAIVI